ncbi:MAG TPA: hypothetical protein VHA70_07265 [Bauldia sp.]|nr:hypothetical protein [Bauldia sp.]
MKFAAAVGGLWLCAGAALAAPAPDAVGAMLTAAVAATGEATLTYAAASASGETVTLSDVKVATPGGSVASVPAVVLSGVADRTGGGFTATHVSFDNGSATSRGDTTTWATASLDDVIVPSADEVKARAKVRPFAKVSAGGIAISGATLAAPIAIGSITTDVGPVVAGTPSNILVKASGVKLPTALLSNTMAGTIVSMLDYDTVDADVTMDSEYDTTADTVTVHLLSIDAAQIGKLTISGKASGLSLKGLTDKAKAKEARAAARLDGLTVRIDNAGVVERMLDMQAQLLGGTRDDVRSQLVDGALPFALSFVKNAAFRDQFQSAVAAFLKDPKSLTITFAPAQPVPLGEVVRTAGRSPTALPDLLSPTVQANN